MSRFKPTPGVQTNITEEQLTSQYGKPRQGLGDELIWETGEVTKGRARNQGKTVPVLKHTMYIKRDGRIERTYRRTFQGE